MTVLSYHPLRFLSLSTIIAALWTALGNSSEFSAHALAMYTLYLFAVLCMQIGTVMIVKKYGPTQGIASHIPAILAALFSVFNFFTIVLIHHNWLMGAPGWFLYGFTGALTLGAIGAFIWRNPQWVRFLSVFLLILLASVVGKFALNHLGLMKQGIANLPDHVRSVTFKDKPNIYVFTFDTLSPPHTVKDILGIEGGTAYEAVMRRHGAINIKNLFAERIPTKNSLSVFLAMDIAYFDGFFNKVQFLRNDIPTPSYKILADNGYKRQFLYKTSYFGSITNLDHYGFAEANGACEHVTSRFAFAGFCFDAVQSLLGTVNNAPDQDYTDFLKDRIDAVAKSDAPWFTFAHIYQPGHAKMTFDITRQADWDEFAIFFERRAEIAAQTMDALLTKIEKTDPDAIVLIFGDHGPLTTYALARHPHDIPAQLPEGSPLSMNEIMQDKFAVRGAVFSRRYCRDSFSREPYSTSRILRDVMICLSRGEDPLPADYQPNDDQWRAYMYE